MKVETGPHHVKLVYFNGAQTNFELNKHKPVDTQ